MENFFSRLALDIIGKAVFNYDFDSLTNDDPVIKCVRSELKCDQEACGREYGERRHDIRTAGTLAYVHKCVRPSLKSPIKELGRVGRGNGSAGMVPWLMPPQGLRAVRVVLREVEHRLLPTHPHFPQSHFHTFSPHATTVPGPYMSCCVRQSGARQPPPSHARSPSSTLPHFTPSLPQGRICRAA